ncbi:MAG: ABC transporter substrate-binding protein [Prevotella sp.]|nr:ABC transporter substrate-binding protein [Prevotella sp.]
MRALFYPLPMVLLLLLCCCTGGNHTSPQAQGDTIRMAYAENITITDYKKYKVVELANPWKRGHLLHRYVLIDSTYDGHTALPEGATVVRVPLRRAVVFNAAHANLFVELGKMGAIAGVADLKYMNIPRIKAAAADGTIADCGNSMAPNTELLASLNCDGILLSPFENSGGYGKLEKMGIPIIECAEYMETSALGRAEWMRFYGMLMGCSNEADSLFKVVESNYRKLASKAKAAGKGKKIITERMTGNIWYVAGGMSSVGRLIADAGGLYAWSDDKHSGSLPLSFETVLSKSGDADVWLFNYNGTEPLTTHRLASEHHGYSEMKALRQANVWYVNTIETPYFEEVSFHPDRLLSDYMLLLHPEMLTDSRQLHYYRKIAP